MTAVVVLGEFLSWAHRNIANVEKGGCYEYTHTIDGGVGAFLLASLRDIVITKRVT